MLKIRNAIIGLSKRIEYIRIYKEANNKYSEKIAYRKTVFFACPAQFLLFFLLCCSAWNDE